MLSIALQEIASSFGSLDSVPDMSPDIDEELKDLVLSKLYICVIFVASDCTYVDFTKGKYYKHCSRSQTEAL